MGADNVEATGLDRYINKDPGRPDIVNLRRILDTKGKHCKEDEAPWLVR